MYKVSMLAVVVVLAFIAPSYADSVEEDVEWCLNGSATNRIDQQPMDRGYCAWVAAGTAVGVWYQQKWAYLIASGTQKHWTRKAAELACSFNYDDMISAVGLAAACQCHDSGRADRIVDNPDKVLTVMMHWAGCLPDDQTYTLDQGASGETPKQVDHGPIVRREKGATETGAPCSYNIFADGSSDADIGAYPAKGCFAIGSFH